MNRVFSLIAFASVFSILLTGCLGSSSSPATTAAATSPACTITVSGTTECILYNASIGQTAVTTACSAVSGTTSAACATTSVLGVCTYNSGSTNAQTATSLTYYSGGAFTNSTAQTDCTNNQSGTYTSG